MNVFNKFRKQFMSMAIHAFCQKYLSSKETNATTSEPIYAYMGNILISICRRLPTHFANSGSRVLFHDTRELTGTSLNIERRRKRKKKALRAFLQKTKLETMCTCCSAITTNPSGLKWIPPVDHDLRTGRTVWSGLNHHDHLILRGSPCRLMKLHNTVGEETREKREH